MVLPCMLTQCRTSLHFTTFDEKYLWINSPSLNRFPYKSIHPLLIDLILQTSLNRFSRHQSIYPLPSWIDSLYVQIDSPLQISHFKFQRKTTHSYDFYRPYMPINTLLSSFKSFWLLHTLTLPYIHTYTHTHSYIHSLSLT